VKRNLQKIFISLCSLCLCGGFLLLSGCAYFNTFYLAQRNYNDAERIRNKENNVTPEAKKKYEDAVTNAYKILQDYKTSGYVDNSVFLIGMSYYYMKDFTRARTKFEELQKAFPTSTFVPRARYYKARCMIEAGLTEDARIELNDLVSKEKGSIKGQAGLTLAEINYKDAQWEDLIAAAQKVIDSKPDKEILCQAMLFKGEGLFNLEKYQEAAGELQKLASNSIETKMKFRANSLIAQSMAKLGKYDEALAFLSSMQSKGEFVNFAPGIRLEIGKIYELKGDSDKAVETFRNMAGDFPDSLAAKEAWYHVGNITIRDLSKAKEAKDAYDKVGKVTVRISESWFADAKNRSAQIDSMNVWTSDIAKLKDKPEEQAHKRFLLAELLTYSLDHADSAVTQYNLILEEAPQSEYAVRSDFSIGLSKLKADKKFSDESEKELMNAIIEKYPDNQFSQELKVHLGMISVPPDVKLYREAELARIEGKGPKVYIPLYEAVADSFPKTRSGFQARFAIAYFYEHDAGDMEKARELYKELAAEKPNENNKAFVELAGKKLSFITDEKKIVAEIQKSIAYYSSGEARAASAAQSSSISGPSPASENEFTELKKIRERNARIRSRYFTN
jgi:tetratricopeptide (TPR) repeat protein